MLLITMALSISPFFQDPAPAPQLPVPVPCKIDAWLDCPGGKIAFVIDVRAPRRKDLTPTFTLLNGARLEDMIWIERWEKTAESLVFHIDSYDSHLEFVDTMVNGELVGTWRKLRGPDDWVEMNLHGKVREEAPAEATPADATFPAIDGRWSVKFSGADDPAVGVFSHPSPGKIAGTFLTTLGDYRYLAGKYDPQSARWELSCFDGAHAFLFSAKPESDGTLSGEFWSSANSHETWTAKKDDKAALADPFGLTKSKPDIDLSKLVYTAIDGTKVSLADPKFAGKGRIIQIFGTWCPNCNDEAAYLLALDSKYRNSGLTIIGLAFEVTGDEARDLEQLKHFTKRHRIMYPLLLGGKADKAEATKAFPLIDAVRAYPTTVFLRADGSVLAVHQGYCGPATGEAHQKQRQEYERLINELLTGKKAK